MDTLLTAGPREPGRDRAAVARYGIDCDFERTGELHVATEPWQWRDLVERRTRPRRRAVSTWFCSTRMRYAARWPPRPTSAGVWDRDGCATVDPARLVWGLRRPASTLGVRIFENTPVERITDDPRRPARCTPGAAASPRAPGGAGHRRVRPLLRRLRQFVVPVYDYALMTEPLIGRSSWRRSAGGNRQGIGDAANQFHYYRLTADNRILWGGYDAVYYNGGRITPELEQREATFEVLAQHFAATFPQLDGLRFTHKWGGVIDCCSRFSAFFGSAYGGRLAYAAGYTGLGVGATRFGAEGDARPARRRADRADRAEDGAQQARSRSRPSRSAPAVIQLTRWSIAQADRDQGRRNLLAAHPGPVGLGFDS